MSQDTVLKLLKKCKKPLSITEIAAKMDIERGSVANNCRRLRNQKDIKFIEVIKSDGEFKRTRRVTKYFV